ncbi:hypothetical protein H696_02976 [Fonticula alba]|uniref:Phosducin domain-containing protein n=1 Tax=Fonticula alba TaxID=691883 RepID=A0A058Z8J7_FONAL|nr:hypothetical protein H696_02976 [Fonticula alba]KCV70619.1 hypothetical protein H696_02976 [Fonticula alba]|eukprot:XP_009495135.1 hypothetical protein H696_02976 [Fonticula alba]
MNNHDEDTEFNDILRARGIIPPKRSAGELEVSEDAIEALLDHTIARHADGTARLERMNLDELDEVEDDFEETLLMEFRQKRIAEMRELAQRSRYGSIQDISQTDYVNEVTNAPAGVPVVVLMTTAQGSTACRLASAHLVQLAQKFPATKFVRGIGSLLVPGYPDDRCPTLMVYLSGKPIRQWVGAAALGGLNRTVDEMEWMLKQARAVESDMEEAPRSSTRGGATASDALRSSIFRSRDLGDDGY